MIVLGNLNGKNECMTEVGVISEFGVVVVDDSGEKAA